MRVSKRPNIAARIAPVLVCILVFCQFCPHVTHASERDDTTRNPAIWAIEWYQDTLSKSKTSTCTMYPSCSVYGRRAFERYPFWKATMLTADRLNRSEHDTGNYQVVQVDGARKHYDPLPDEPKSPPTDLFPKASVAPIHPVDVYLQQNIPPPTEAERFYDFAGYLHALGKHDEALIEYLRFLRMFQESELTSAARVRVMNLHYDSQHYQDAIMWAEQNLSTQGFGDADLGGVYFWLGASYLKIGNAAKARDYIDRSVNLQQSQFVEQGILLKGYAYAQEDKWQEAKGAFQEYQQKSEDPERGKALVTVCDAALKHRKKSPVLAGVLGVVPGLGYLYAGHPGTALSALLIDSLLLASSYKAFDDGNTPLGALLGVVGVGWYAGSIYGSVSAAERNNERDQRERLLQLKLGFRF